MTSDALDPRSVAPPRGITVARSSVLDPLFGRSDRWGYRGEVDGRAVFGCGHVTREAACLAAWTAVGDDSP